MTPARAHAQRAQARKCCWLTLRHIKKEKYFGLCLWSGSQTMLILQLWYPFSSGTPMTMGWTLTTVHLLFSAGVTGRGVWWVWWSGSSTLQKGLFYWHMLKVAQHGSDLFLPEPWLGSMGGRWCCCFARPCEPTCLLMTWWDAGELWLFLCGGCAGTSSSSSSVGSPKASLCHVSPWRPGCLAQAAERGASCLFKFFWHLRNVHPLLKLHFKVFNPWFGRIPRAWMCASPCRFLTRGSWYPPLTQGLGLAAWMQCVLKRPSHAGACLWLFRCSMSLCICCFVIQSQYAQLAEPAVVLLQIMYNEVKGSFGAYYVPLYLARWETAVGGTLLSQWDCLKQNSFCKHFEVCFLLPQTCPLGSEVWCPHDSEDAQGSPPSPEQVLSLDMLPWHAVVVFLPPMWHCVATEILSGSCCLDFRRGFAHSKPSY